jgi:hypothetical protein
VVKVIFPDQNAFWKKTGCQFTYFVSRAKKRLLSRGYFTGKLTVETRIPQTQMTLQS